MRRITILALLWVTSLGVWAQEPETPSPTPTPAVATPTPKVTPTPEVTATPTPEALEPEVLRVVVVGPRPFVVPIGKDFEGLSIETWRVLAKELGYDFELEAIDRIDEALDGVQSGRFDVAVGPISITSERSLRGGFFATLFRFQPGDIDAGPE